MLAEAQIASYTDDHHDSDTGKPNVSHDFSGGKGFPLGFHHCLLALGGSLRHGVLGQLVGLRIFCRCFYHLIGNVLHRGGDALALGNRRIQQAQQGHWGRQGHRAEKPEQYYRPQRIGKYLGGFA